MSRMQRALLFFALVFVPTVLLFAGNFPEKPDGYVTDHAVLLRSDTRQQLESTLADFEKKTSNQVVVAIFPSLDGEVIENFSIRLAEKWKIGQAGKHNGVILLIFPNDRQLRIEVGYGLEGALPDITAKQIIDQVITPEFKQGRMDNGVLQGVNAIIQAIHGEFKPAPSDKKPGDPFLSAPQCLLFIIAAAVIGAFFPQSVVYGVNLLLLFWLIQVMENDYWLTALQAFLIWVGFLAAYLVSGRPLFDSQTIGGGRRGPALFSGSSGGGRGGFSGGGGGGFGGGGASGRW